MSLAYQTFKLAQSPALYWRLDKVGAAADGDVISDISGNALHGEARIFGSAAPYGYPTAIETDVTSRAMLIYNQPAVSSAFVERNTNVLIEATGNFTIEGWFALNIGTVANAAALFYKRNAFGDAFCYGLRVDTAAKFIGQMRDSANTTWAVASTISATLGQYYYVVLVRLGNALSLYINGALNATTTITSGLPTLNESGKLQLAGQISGDYSYQADEVAVTLAALSGPTILAQYEAALNVLHSSATITVRVPVTLDTDSVEPVDFAFTHNWTDPIGGSERPLVETLSWKTLNNRSEPDYQQRIGARSYGPLRSLEYAITPTTARARTALQRALWQPAQFYKLPIATDWVVLTAQANASDVLLNCDTTLRDFEVGSYVTVWRNVYDPSSAQTFRITSRSDTQLGITPAVAVTFPVGSQLMPARLACLPDESSTFDSYTIDSETGALRFEILSTELSTRRVTAYVPTDTHESIEVFSLDSARYDILDQVQYQLQRRQAGTGLLTGNDYYRMVDTLAPATIPVRVLLGTRETLSSFYGWLNARQGRRNPVWVPSRDNDLEYVSGSGGSITTRGYSVYNLHYGRRHVQFVYADGSVANRKITTMVDNGNGTETLTVASIPGGTVVKISLLRLCVAPDTFQLNFHRDIATIGGMIVECAWEFTELLTTP